jgi:hypothetical protein
MYFTQKEWEETEKGRHAKHGERMRVSTLICLFPLLTQDTRPVPQLNTPKECLGNFFRRQWKEHERQRREGTHPPFSLFFVYSSPTSLFPRRISPKRANDELWKIDSLFSAE